MNSSENQNNEYKSALNSAYRYLARRDHSIYELKQKLQKKKYDNGVIDSVIERLVELDYLNDLEFARSYIRHCQKIKHIGLFRISYELRKKGISRDLIDIAADEYSGDLEKDIIKKLIQSSLESGKSKEKVVRYLQRKGFHPERIMKYIRLM